MGPPVDAPMDGFVRGIARDNVQAARDVKLVKSIPATRLELDGNGQRGRAIADAVVEAIACAPNRRWRPLKAKATLH